MAGLFAGALLAREGMQVTVLEKEPTPGGLLASFKRKGQWFDTGVHYIGSLAPQQVLWKYFNALDLFPLCQFDRMDETVFEEYRFPDAAFQVPQNWDDYIQHMVTAFPADKEKLLETFAEWRSIADHFPMYNLDATFEPGREEIMADPKALMSLSVYLEERFPDPKLRAVLSANNALYGIAPDECPLYIHALIVDSFVNSAWRVHGPSQNLCQALVQRLEEAGGELRTRACVSKIVSSGGTRAEKVVLTTGEELPADWIVSTIHPKEMLLMLEDQAVRPIYRKRINGLEETIAAFVLSVVFKGEGLPTSRTNYFLHNSWDTAAAYHLKPDADPYNPEAVFVSPVEGAPGKAKSCTLMCPMPWSVWAPWAESTRATRPEAYKQAKERMSQALIQRLKIIWPDVESQVEYYEGSTPLTFRDYTHTWEGSSYGIKKDCNRLREATLSVRTRLDNVMLAGQSVVLPGILGVSVSAAVATGHIMGFPNLKRRLTGK